MNSQYTPLCPDAVQTLSPIKTQKSQSAQSGFSLIELMVSMVIGLIISAGAAALFANTALSTKTLNNATQMHEAGSYITQLLGRQLRMAGYVDWMSTTTTLDTLTNTNNLAAYRKDATTTDTLFGKAFDVEMGAPGRAVHGCTDGYADTGDLFNITCASVSNELRNGLTVSYQVQTNPNANNAPSLNINTNSTVGFSSKVGMSGDCNNQSTLGASTNKLPKGWFAVNRYYVNSENVMFCQGNGGSPQPLASNIEQFVVTYAIGKAGGDISNDEQVMYYKTAAQIEAAGEWGRVIAAQVCVLLAGEPGSLAVANNSAVTNRYDCNPTTPTFIQTTDRKLRQVFFSTVAIRNQIHTPTALFQ